MDPSTAGSTARAETLAPGQILTLATPVSLEGDLQVCSNEGLIQVEVMAVGEHFAFAQDLASAVKLSDQYFAELLGQVESEVVSVSEAYFGEPRDLDGNGVVVGVVTPEVNRPRCRGVFRLVRLHQCRRMPDQQRGRNPVAGFSRPVWRPWHPP